MVDRVGKPSVKNKRCAQRMKSTKTKSHNFGNLALVNRKACQDLMSMMESHAE